MAILSLPGQLELPQCSHDRGGELRRKSMAPLKPTTAQQPMDIGLFSDDAAQLDIVEMLQEPTND